MTQLQRYRVIILFLLLSTSCLAQQHLSFMGIPINGTIKSFELKLKAKGLMPDRESNKSRPYGERMFNGLYIGRECTFLVRYTGKTKTVYGIEIRFSDENQNKVIRFESDFIEGVKKKYKGSHLIGEENSISDKTVYIYNAKDANNYSWDNVVGILKTEWMTIRAIPRESYSDLKEKIISTVTIYYIDKVNTELRDEENASDI